MSSTNFRYIILRNGVGAGLLNLLLNGIFGWALLRGRGELPVWGLESVVTDTLVMVFLLAFMTCLVVGRQTRKDVLRGKVHPGALPGGLVQLIDRLPPSDLGRAVALGAAGLVICAAPALAWFATTGWSVMTATHFVVFKGSLAGAQAAVFTPLSVVLAWTRSAEASPAS